MLPFSVLFLNVFQPVFAANKNFLRNQRDFCDKMWKNYEKPFAFFQNGDIFYNMTQTYGVTVAQVILVHFVEVRILVGLPFFLSFF